MITITLVVTLSVLSYVDVLLWNMTPEAFRRRSVVGYLPYIGGAIVFFAYVKARGSNDAIE